MKSVKAVFSILMLSACMSFGVQAQESERNIYDKYFEATKPITHAVSEELNKFSNALVNQTSLGRYNTAGKLKSDSQVLRVTRSVRDCIKPGGLIDDDVQMCVNGTREKTW